MGRPGPACCTAGMLHVGREGVLDLVANAGSCREPGNGEPTGTWHELPREGRLGTTGSAVPPGMSGVTERAGGE